MSSFCRNENPNAGKAIRVTQAISQELPHGKRNLVHPLLHLPTLSGDIHLELNADGVLPSGRVPARGHCLVEGVGVVCGNGAITLILHDGQLVVVHIEVTGAIEIHGDVVPGIRNEPLARHVGVDPPPGACIPDVPNASAVAALGAEHVAAIVDELEDIEFKCLCQLGIGVNVKPKTKAETFGCVIRTDFVPPQCVTPGIAVHIKVAAVAFY